MSLVAEQMNYFEEAEASEGMISYVVKTAFSILFTLTALSYAFNLDKVSRTGNVKTKRSWLLIFD